MGDSVGAGGAPTSVIKVRFSTSWSDGSLVLKADVCLRVITLSVSPSISVPTPCDISCVAEMVDASFDSSASFGEGSGESRAPTPSPRWSSLTSGPWRRAEISEILLEPVCESAAPLPGAMTDSYLLL